MKKTSRRIGALIATAGIGVVLTFGGAAAPASAVDYKMGPYSTMSQCWNAMTAARASGGLILKTCDTWVDYRYWFTVRF
ncbi:hypothetical protein [Agromyces sp. ZXT2-3]|uniref:hypothetical protein n=1 Tax=Agromyces sp. ZXT2-3 TaxID=3461152 RepID=UPI0040551613